MTSHLFVFTRAFAKEGLQQLMAAAIEEVLGPTRQEIGCLAIDAFGSSREPRRFFINSRWQDEAAFDDHLRFQHTLKFLDAMKSLLDEPMKITRAERLLLPLPICEIDSNWV